MSLDASQGILRDYINWLLDKCTDDKMKVKDIIEDQAVDYLAEHLTTPLQLFKGDLDPTRAKEMTAEMREAGLPI